MCETRLWGLTAEERQRRVFARAGVHDVVSANKQLDPGRPVVLIRAEYVLEERLVKALVAKPGVLLYRDGSNDGTFDAVAARVPAARLNEVKSFLETGSFTDLASVPQDLLPETPEQLGPTYNVELRKRQAPFCHSLELESLSQIEKDTFKAVYKGATDFVTKYWWPWPARHVTRWAAERRISPNSITSVSLVFVLIAFGLFWEGYFLLGCLAGWFMTFLDTVDGKLARVTLTSSQWGNIYDHAIDLIHPPFWYWAWWHGVSPMVAPEVQGPLDLALQVIVVGYVLGRIFELIFIRGFGFEMHVWRPVDFAMRSITARRNPNLFLLMVFALFSQPVLGFYAVALWTVVCLVFHAVRILQAARLKRQGGAVRSWMMDPA